MSLEATLDLIKNADLYSKRLQELKDAENAANDAAKKLVKAKDIDAALISAEQAAQSAQVILKDAREKSARTEEDADKAAKRIVAEAQNIADSVEAELLRKRKELDQVTLNTALVTDHLDKIKTELDKVTAEADRLAQANEVLRSQIVQRQAALQALLS